MTDPITDLLNRIKNAYAAGHQTVKVPFSKTKMKISEVLKEQGMIKDCKTKGRKALKCILIDLQYKKDKKPALAGFKRVSKPGQKIYKSAGDIRLVKSGYGFAIVSTSKGIMLGREARKQNIGGEMMLNIW